MTRYFAYHFEARSIQSFILDSGRLRDVVGASELVDALARRNGDDLLALALEAVNFRVEPQFARRAGSAFTMVTTEEDGRDRLRALWTLILRLLVPELTYSEGIGAGDSARKAITTARESAMVRKNTESDNLPPPSPLAERVRRTGRAVVVREKSEDLDSVTRAKRRFARTESLVERFAPAQSGMLVWPRDLSGDPEAEKAFPFIGDRRLVAVVHADGNGMGRMLAALPKAVEQNGLDYIATFGDFSRSLGEATEAAAKRAVAEVLLPAHREEVVPARPIVLGGDDLVAIFRADLAFPFVLAFLEAFEEETRARLARQSSWPEKVRKGMTAAAGIAFVHAHHPYHLAHQLAEALCRHAKAAARIADSPSSSLAFFRSTGSYWTDYAALLEEELTFRKDGRPIRNTLGAYAVRQGSCSLPSARELLDLARVVRSARAGGGLRQIGSLLFSDVPEAERAWRRWLRNVEERRETGGKEKRRMIEEGFTNLVGAASDGLPIAGDRTPIGDVVTLVEVGT